MSKENSGLYIQMFSIHGLLRGHDLEMGRDADTGGQIKYVVELARQLGSMEGVRKVDLFTRYIDDKTVSDDYALPVEEVDENFRIIRIQCGGKKYYRKELLWPFLEEFIDKTIKFIKEEKAIPDIIHGHYADAGYVAMQLARFFGIPFVFTGHSLGRSKLSRLQSVGMTEDDVHKKYKIRTRIEKEEEVLQNADLVITSTSQEVDEQYGVYENHSLPRYNVIPPGLDIEKFYPYYHDMMPDRNKEEREILAHASVLQELNRFFMHPDKPLVLTLCRPDKRKNINGLIKAYGEDKELQAIANLAIFAGIRRDINEMEDNEQDVLTSMLIDMDRYDLYGKMAIPKKHNFEYEVPELYRIAAEKNGVFVNVALTEPFGITLIEASSCGIPIVATNNGGPIDIIENLKNGILVDPADTKAISEAIRTILINSEQWKEFSINGIMNVRNYYTWEAHAVTYLKEIHKITESQDKAGFEKFKASTAVGRRLTSLQHFIITDIDDTLIGRDNPDNSHLEEFIELITAHHDTIGFGIATGRHIDSAMEHLEKHGIPSPDVLITSVGTEIHYGTKDLYDRGWDAHLSNKWNPEAINDLLLSLPFVEKQAEENQRPFKISYDMDPAPDRLAEIHHLLKEKRFRYNLIYSHNRHLDILPYRASKGKAIRYLSYKWGIPLEQILVAGDSGNDEEMLRGDPCAVVVGNYSKELESLRGSRRVYFANEVNAGALLEGIEYYRFTKKGR